MIVCTCGMQLHVPSSIVHLNCPKCKGLLLDRKNPNAVTTIDQTRVTDLIDSLSDKWHQLHRWPLRNTTATSEQIESYYQRWRSSIGCMQCKQHFTAVEELIIPDFASPEAFSRWGWKAHNHVNTHKDNPTPEISYEECIEIHNRIAIGLYNACYMKIGGVETWMQSVVPQLRKSFRVEGLVVTDQGMYQGSPQRLGIRSAVGSMACGKLAECCDVVITWNVWGLDRAFARHRPYVIAMHHGHPESDWTNQFILKQLDQIDCIACVSDRTAEMYRSKTTKRIENIGCSIDPARSTSSVPVDQLREKYGFTGKKALLWVARQSAEKRPEVAIDALNYLPDDWIVAMVSDNKPSMTHDRLRLFIGIENPAEFYAAADVFASTSREEGFGISVGEAMLGACPTVTPRWGTALRDDLVTRIQTDSMPAQVASAVLDAYGQRDRAVRASDYVRSYYSIESIGQQWRELIDSAVSFPVPWLN